VKQEDPGSDPRNPLPFSHGEDVNVGPRGWELVRVSVVPSVQFTPAFLALVVGILGTTISPYLFFWQCSEEVEELADSHTGRVLRRASTMLSKQLRALRIDTVAGMVASEVTTWFIIFTTGSVLFTHGVRNITTADQAASALTPLVHNFPNAGELTRLLFALGILGTGLLAIPVLAGSAAYCVAEVFGWREGLAQPARHARGFYLVIAGATLVGLLIPLLGINPIAALVYTAIINGVVAVPLLVLILLVANNRQIMGDHTNGRLSNIVSIFTTVAMGAAAVFTIVALF
jgi:Mn2+/Fe2+ NRAMP family transporter